jgi:hypothetical protein
MRSSRLAFTFALMTSVSLSLTVAGHNAPKASAPNSSDSLYPLSLALYHGFEPLGEAPPVGDQGTGIKEDIPVRYLARYGEWKKEFLSTEAGRSQWASYRDNPQFALTITVSPDNAEGATTGKYKWNEAGQLVAATISLGLRLDQGYPNPIYFPVMNSLVPTESSYRVSGYTLAATKLAHEFGHVNRTAKVNATLYQLQTQLIPQYNKILLSNGRDVSDPRLLELAQRMGGTPVEVWEDREYWGEANAFIYLRDRVTEDRLRCLLFTRIRHSVDLYAKNYEGRFMEIVQSKPASHFCGWE